MHAQILPCFYLMYSQQHRRMLEHKTKAIAILLLLVLQVSADTVDPSHQAQSTENCQIADTIYINGNIITMDDPLDDTQDENHSKAKVVAVKDGKILKVAHKRNDLKSCEGQTTKIVNLHGHTMVPGFVDPHSHFSLTAVVQSLGFSITPPPFGTVTSIQQMLQNAKDYIERENIPAGQKVYSEGYSDYQVVEHRHPTRFQLDWVSTVHPVMFKHFSAHVIVANSLAIQLLGIDDTTTPPPGGIFERFANGSLTGVFKEYAILPFVVNYAINFAELSTAQIMSTVESYFRVGITTAHDISFSMAEPTVFKALGDSLPIDINSYFWISSADRTNLYNVMENYSTNRVKHRGAKFLLDGSIQAYTALLGSPYWVPKAQQYDNLDNYVYDNTRSCSTESCGQNNFPYQSLLRLFFKDFHDRGYDVLAHCNGDGILDNFLDALEYTRNNSQTPTASNFVVIHGQTARDQQLDKLKALDGSVSFFSPHIYYWGDQHYKIFLGPERANRMNPAKSAVDKNILFTLHNDCPVIMNSIFDNRNTFIGIMEAAINRQTSGDKRTLGEEQKITPYQALKAVTINSAIQSHEQDTKGSITVGKKADFVILSRDPLHGNTKHFKDLQVLATIKEDKLVFGEY